MLNELVKIKNNWLELKKTLDKLPMPFSREVSLMECTIAGTTHIDGIVTKTATVFEGTILTLIRDPKNKYDSDAIAVQTDAGERIGWVPQRKNEVISRLMDAGKLIYAKVKSKDFEGRWLKIDIEIFMRDA